MYNANEYDISDVAETAQKGLDQARKALARLIQNDDYESLSPDDQSMVESSLLSLRHMSNKIKRIQ